MNPPDTLSQSGPSGKHSARGRPRVRRWRDTDSYDGATGYQTGGFALKSQEEYRRCCQRPRATWVQVSQDARRTLIVLEKGTSLVREAL